MGFTRGPVGFARGFNWARLGPVGFTLGLGGFVLRPVGFTRGFDVGLAGFRWVLLPAARGFNNLPCLRSASAVPNKCKHTQDTCTIVSIFTRHPDCTHDDCAKREPQHTSCNFACLGARVECCAVVSNCDLRHRGSLKMRQPVLCSDSSTHVASLEVAPSPTRHPESNMRPKDHGKNDLDSVRNTSCTHRGEGKRCGGHVNLCHDGSQQTMPLRRRRGSSICTTDHTEETQCLSSFMDCCLSSPMDYL